ncbi:MAG: divalent-cation tolerance protein CutA [Parvularculaceae bacterium]|nr:divalent-cation tolerance protein CutA [Parvularculaceae bacterium]
MDGVVFLYVTAPDDAVASGIAEKLVSGGLAVCVNILPRIRSVYRWKGAVERAEEAAMIVKTTVPHAAAARRLVERLHPYETPVIAAISIEGLHSGEKFLAWIDAELSETLS